FTARNKATAELEKLADLAEPALRKVLAGQPPLEVRRRAALLLARLQEPITSAELLRSLRALEVLEHLGTKPARELLATLAEGGPEARLTQEAQAAMKRLAKRPLSP